MIFRQDLLSSINSKFRAQHEIIVADAPVLGNDLNTHTRARG